VRFGTPNPGFKRPVAFAADRSKSVHVIPLFAFLYVCIIVLCIFHGLHFQTGRGSLCFMYNMHDILSTPNRVKL